MKIKTGIEYSLNNQALINTHITNTTGKPEKKQLNTIKKTNKLKRVMLYIDERVAKKLIEDCFMRGKQPVRRRVMEIVIKSYASKINEILSYSLHENTDLLKRSGYGKIVGNSKTSRVKYALDYSNPSYKIAWEIVLKLAAKYNMMVGTFVSACVERYYSNQGAAVHYVANSKMSAMFDRALLSKFGSVPETFDNKGTPRFRRKRPVNKYMNMHRLALRLATQYVKTSI